MNYDAIIIGAGPGGIFSAYELTLQRSDLKVAVFEAGHALNKRRCPIDGDKIKSCISCPSCSIMSGFGGAGAFSDGKLSLYNPEDTEIHVGGNLHEYIGIDKTKELIDYTDNIYLEFGADPKIEGIEFKDEVSKIKEEAKKHEVTLHDVPVRHLGTEINLQVLKNIYEHMKPHMDFLFKTEVLDILVEDDVVKGVLTADGEIHSDYVILGVGRNGADWLVRTLKNHDIKFRNNKVDVGVRVETNDIVMKEINETLYEGKFIFNTSVGTTVRTFCSNPSGHVVVENHNGIMVCNGHAYHDHKLGSRNTNFALLVSHEFDEPFNNPNDFAYEISKLANKLSGGGVIVQKYGDIKKGRRSTERRIAEGFVKPTLTEAVPGDLGLVLPYNTMKSLIEMVQALDYVTPGIANDHTLFYGVEAKFYSDRPEVDSNFETKIKNLYVGGDGAGITRGLAQAGANGVHIARTISKR